MPDFHYSALDAAGRTRTGRIRAETSEAARSALMRQKLFALRVDAAAGAAPIRASGRRLNVKQLTLFTRQVATLVQVAPLEETLRTIVRQSEAAHVQRVLARVHVGVVEGRRLSEAMALEPASFPPLYRAMVSAGESSGSLPEILERLADLQERQAAVRGKVVAAIAYPAALAIVATVVVIALMIFVVPKVVAQFEDIGQALPLLTRIVIGLSHFLSSWWWALLIGFVGGGLLFARAMRDEAFRLRFDTWLLGLPLMIHGKRVGQMFRAERRGHSHTVDVVHTARVRRRGQGVDGFGQ